MGAKRHFALLTRLRGGDAILPIEGRTQLPLLHVRAAQETGADLYLRQKSLTAIEAESTVWGFISELLQDPRKIRAGMKTLIE